MKKKILDIIALVIIIIVIILLLSCPFLIAVSDMPDWVKFYLLCR